uniref:Uncharacterized protein n=1 Tax=Myotis myotis TaxID=51298 RepID=A0A7J7V3Q9_MYOMY|nr:hypothetical protein mMyoMyo1_008482 [Myotis myotis]
MCLFKLRQPHSCEHPQLLFSLVFPIPGFSICHSTHLSASTICHSTHLSASTFIKNEVLLFSNQRYPTWTGTFNLNGVGFLNTLASSITYRAVTYKMGVHSHCPKNLTVVSDLGMSFSWDLTHLPLLSPFLLTTLNSQCLLISASEDRNKLQGHRSLLKGFSALEGYKINYVSN